MILTIFPIWSSVFCEMSFIRLNSKMDLLRRKTDLASINCSIGLSESEFTCYVPISLNLAFLPHPYRVPCHKLGQELDCLGKLVSALYHLKSNPTYHSSERLRKKHKRNGRNLKASSVGDAAKTLMLSKDRRSTSHLKRILGIRSKLYVFLARSCFDSFLYN